MTTFVCSQCNKPKIRLEFTETQLRKKARRRCTTCTQATQTPSTTHTHPSITVTSTHQSQKKKRLCTPLPKKIQNEVNAWGHMYIADNWMWQRCKEIRSIPDTKPPLTIIQILHNSSISQTEVEPYRIAPLDVNKLNKCPAMYDFFMKTKGKELKTKQKEMQQTIDEYAKQSSEHKADGESDFGRIIAASMTTAKPGDDSSDGSDDDNDDSDDQLSDFHIPKLKNSQKYTDYAKRMQNLKQMIPFKGKFPWGEDSYFQYTLDIEEFYSTNAHMDVDVLFNCIYKDLTHNQRQQWISYKRDKCEEYEMGINDDDSDDFITIEKRAAEQAKFYKTI